MGGDSVGALHVIEKGIDELRVVDADGYLFEDVVECDVGCFETEIKH